MLLKLVFAQKRRLIDILKETGIDISLPTAYRYIVLGKIDIKKIDLTYATTYKKESQIKCTTILTIKLIEQIVHI